MSHMMDILQCQISTVATPQMYLLNTEQSVSKCSCTNKSKALLKHEAQSLFLHRNTFAQFQPFEKVSLHVSSIKHPKSCMPILLNLIYHHKCLPFARNALWLVAIVKPQLSTSIRKLPAGKNND